MGDAEKRRMKHQLDELHQKYIEGRDAFDALRGKYDSLYRDYRECRAEYDKLKDKFDELSRQFVSVKAGETKYRAAYAKAIAVAASPPKPRSRISFASEARLPPAPRSGSMKDLHNRIHQGLDDSSTLSEAMAKINLR